MKRILCKAITMFVVVSIVFQCFQLILFAESAEKIDLIQESIGADITDLIPDGAPNLTAKSVILMEETTGAILYAKNANEELPPASVTKIMTLLLIMEAIDEGMLKLTDTVTVSANAASMGGSQVYLKEGEQMILEDMLKSVVIASANDAAVALAEHLCGSVSSFVDRMNQRAEQLGMTHTKFENVTGLDDTAENHLTSAHDIALMSQALIKHETILKYSSIWMDTIRDGAFGLTNTNRLVRFYNGCTGLKTGSTSKAGFCVSVTAKRDALSLICVIMGAETRDIRNAEATMLLDWGFSNYDLYRLPAEEMSPIYVTAGKQSYAKTISAGFSCVLPKKEFSSVERVIDIPTKINAPIKQGDTVGKITLKLGDQVIGECAILSLDTVGKINFFNVLQRITAKFLLI